MSAPGIATGNTSPAGAAQLAAAPGLREQTPLEIVDGAFALLRSAGIEAVTRGFVAGLPLAVTIVLIYYLERVEGIQQMRLLFGMLLTAAFWWRAVALGRLARTLALRLRPALPMPALAGRPIDVVCTASIVGLGLWLWLWPVAGLAKLSPFACLFMLPILAVRGAVAPSWLARAACAQEQGFAAFGRAVDDNVGVRGVMTVVELMLLIGALGVFVNVYALMAFGLMLASSLLGLEVAFVSAFVSPDNDLVLLLMAATSFVLMEPLRAAVSAHAFTDARGRKDGADLHAAIDALISAGQRASHGPVTSGARYGSAALLLLALSTGGWVQPARADAPASVAQPSTGDVPLVPAAGPDPRDERVRAQVEMILKGKEFSEFAKSDTRSFWKWIQDFVDHLLSLAPKEEEETSSSNWHLSLPDISPWLLGFSALLLMLLAVRHVTEEARRRKDHAKPSESKTRMDPSEHEPKVFLDEASQLAAQGRLREALRALYVATLAALDRARLIRFEPAKTNGQYLRAMPHNDMRTLFAAFTRVFDHKWYGREPTSLEDYERCRKLADRICNFEPGS